MNEIRAFIHGEPKGQPRPRAFAMKGNNGKASARVYDPGTAEGWKSQVAEAFRNELPATPHEIPLYVCLSFYMPRPNKHFRTGKHSHELRPDAPTYYTKTPDADNLAKAVLDALTTLGMWKDDSYVVRLVVTKQWVNPGTASGCWITVKGMEDACTE